jgi:hypothetical protein
MANQMKQFLGGAALAAILTLPSAGAFSAEDRTWIQHPAQSFAAHDLDLERVVADVTINVTNGGPVTMSVSGPKFLVDGVQSHMNGATLVVTGPKNAEMSFSVWDISKWFDYSDVGDKARVKVVLNVPRGTDVVAHKMIGDMRAGDLESHVTLESAAGDIVFGKVSEAHLKAAGSGDISIAGVSGPLELGVAGSGDIKVGPSATANVSIAGSGDTTLGPVNGALRADIAGSGDLVVGGVNGPVTISIAGAGDVKINGGQATPLKVSIVGAGDFGFAGNAVDPTISAIGSGDVWIKSYTGKLSSSGMADVTIGEHKNSGGTSWTPPVPPAPAVKPVKPVKPVRDDN